MKFFYTIKSNSYIAKNDSKINLLPLANNQKFTKPKPGFAAITAIQAYPGTAAVAASPVETEMLNVIPEERKAAFKKTLITGRFATPTEIAETIGWFGTVSPEYINGTCIDINNGSFPR